MICSYMPFNVARIVVVNYDRYESFAIRASIEDVQTWYWVTLFTRSAMFLTPALNPLVLYFLSSKFRRCFKSYLCCKTHDLH